MIITNLLTNMIVLTVSGSIPTNTAAFQQYASDLLLTNAQAVASKLHLEERVIEGRKITDFGAVPWPNGPTAYMLFEKRYLFKTLAGHCLSLFSDEAYSSRALFPKLTNVSDIQSVSERTRAVYERLRASTNQLNLQKARDIAESSMQAFGVDRARLEGFKDPVKAQQMIWRDDVIMRFQPDGAVVNEKKEQADEYALPYYSFRWETKPGTPHAACEVEVCGISGTTVFFHFAGPGSLRQSQSNYLEILGLPTNTVFVKRRTFQPRTYETVE